MNKFLKAPQLREGDCEEEINFPNKVLIDKEEHFITNFLNKMDLLFPVQARTRLTVARLLHFCTTNFPSFNEAFYPTVPDPRPVRLKQRAERLVRADEGGRAQLRQGQRGRRRPLRRLLQDRCQQEVNGESERRKQKMRYPHKSRRFLRSYPFDPEKNYGGHQN